jgi:hypothetical protein
LRRIARARARVIGGGALRLELEWTRTDRGTLESEDSTSPGLSDDSTSPAPSSSFDSGSDSSSDTQPLARNQSTRARAVASETVPPAFCSLPDVPWIIPDNTHRDDVVSLHFLGPGGPSALSFRFRLLKQRFPLSTGPGHTAPAAMPVHTYVLCLACVRDSNDVKTQPHVGRTRAGRTG